MKIEWIKKVSILFLVVCLCLGTPTFATPTDQETEQNQEEQMNSNDRSSSKGIMSAISDREYNGILERERRELYTSQIPNKSNDFIVILAKAKSKSDIKELVKENKNIDSIQSIGADEYSTYLIKTSEKINPTILMEQMISNGLSKYDIITFASDFDVHLVTSDIELNKDTELNQYVSSQLDTNVDVLVDELIIADIGGGFDTTHEALKHYVYRNSSELNDNQKDDDRNGYINDVSGWDFYNNKPFNVEEELDKALIHGTNVAGVIVANNNELIQSDNKSANIKLMPVKVHENNQTSLSRLIEGIYYADAQGAKIANMGWWMYNATFALKEAMEKTEMLFVIPAGDGSTSVEVNTVIPNGYGLYNCITVTSINSNNGLSFFANYGPYSIDSFEYGENIATTTIYNDYTHRSGTTFAAASLTGQIAVYSAFNPKLKAKHLKTEVMFDKMSSSFEIKDGDYIFRKFSEEDAPLVQDLQKENESFLDRLVDWVNFLLDKE